MKRGLGSIVLLAAAACSGTSAPDKPPGEAPQPPATPPVDASTAPVNTAAPEAEFWKKGDAACPDGAKLAGLGTPNVYCAESSGPMHGPAATFGDGGRLLELTMYSHGKRDGKTISFNPDGSKRYEATMRQNNQHGLATRYHPNGQKASEGSYRDGRPDGTFRAWSPAGQELGSFIMKNGTGTQIEWHENGQKAWEQPMVNGQAHGIIVHWHPNGSKASESHYSHGKASGAATSWSDQGRVVQKGQYRNDAQDGDWTFYDPASGQVVRVDRYAAGQQLATIDYQDGKPLPRPLPAQGSCTTDQGAAAAFATQSGKKVDDERPCIRRAPHFPGLVVFGAFAHDRGCAPIGALLDCKLIQSVDAARLLDRAGWAAARAPAREKIAMNYLREVHIGWEGSITDDPDPPRVVAEKDGGVTITAWVREPSGMTRETPQHLTELRFSAKGSLASKVLKSMTK